MAARKLGLTARQPETEKAPEGLKEWLSGQGLAKFGLMKSSGGGAGWGAGVGLGGTSGDLAGLAAALSKATEKAAAAAAASSEA
ncbi:hypothetical protein ETH_00036205, partial [Eimeria tenella]